MPLEEADGGGVTLSAGALMSCLPGPAVPAGLLESGEGVALVPKTAQLTTQQAADMLNVSRPYLIGLPESGQSSVRSWGCSDALHRRL